MPPALSLVHHYYRPFQGNLENLYLIPLKNLWYEFGNILFLFLFSSHSRLYLLLSSTSTPIYLLMALCPYLWCNVFPKYQTKFLVLFLIEPSRYCIGYSISTSQNILILVNSTFLIQMNESLLCWQIIHLVSKMDRIGYNPVCTAGASFCKKNKHTWMKYINIFLMVISEWGDDL